MNTKNNDSDCSHETSSLETKLNKLIITSLKIMFLCYFTAMNLYDVSTQTQKNDNVKRIFLLRDRDQAGNNIHNLTIS